ncbi:MAG: phosphatidylinositol-specific phospholipase C/glycerophosphodiester phosphodiesterase family protein [Cytophagales bacterium]|nr:phosphatidylinositol-specific phospholipase C/glycerophosphodiester phosphodiesterase family protein [Cytophagales bacterium]
MNRYLFLFVFLWHACPAQPYTSAAIFAHNDYEKPIPFDVAYKAQVGFIEADVFFKDENLFVAHESKQIQKDKTLESLYLNPLNKLIEENGGHAYADEKKSLTLMIDLKTEEVATLNALISKLKIYPRLIECKTLIITLSGNMPTPALWINYPDFIHFDGRPGITYTAEQQKRIRLVSDNFRKYSTWDGKGALTKSDEKKINSVIEAAHAMNKPFRFWAIPDFPESWKKLIQLRVDILNTDDVVRACCLFKEWR